MLHYDAHSLNLAFVNLMFDDIISILLEQPPKMIKKIQFKSPDALSTTSYLGVGADTDRESCILLY